MVRLADLESESRTARARAARASRLERAFEQRGRERVAGRFGAEESRQEARAVAAEERASDLEFRARGLLTRRGRAPTSTDVDVLMEARRLAREEIAAERRRGRASGELSGIRPSNQRINRLSFLERSFRDQLGDVRVAERSGRTPEQVRRAEQTAVARERSREARRERAEEAGPPPTQQEIAREQRLRFVASGESVDASPQEVARARRELVSRGEGVDPDTGRRIGVVGETAFAVREPERSLRERVREGPRGFRGPGGEVRFSPRTGRPVLIRQGRASQEGASEVAARLGRPEPEVFGRLDLERREPALVQSPELRRRLGLEPRGFEPRGEVEVRRQVFTVPSAEAARFAGFSGPGRFAVLSSERNVLPGRVTVVEDGRERVVDTRGFLGARLPRTAAAVEAGSERVGGFFDRVNREAIRLEEEPLAFDRTFARRVLAKGLVGDIRMIGREAQEGGAELSSLARRLQSEAARDVQELQPGGFVQRRAETGVAGFAVPRFAGGFLRESGEGLERRPVTAGAGEAFTFAVPFGAASRTFRLLRSSERVGRAGRAARTAGRFGGRAEAVAGVGLGGAFAAQVGSDLARAESPEAAGRVSSGALVDVVGFGAGFRAGRGVVRAGEVSAPVAREAAEELGRALRREVPRVVRGRRVPEITVIDLGPGRRAELSLGEAVRQERALRQVREGEFSLLAQQLGRDRLDFAARRRLEGVRESRERRLREEARRRFETSLSQAREPDLASRSRFLRGFASRDALVRSGSADRALAQAREGSLRASASRRRATRARRQARVPPLSGESVGRFLRGFASRDALVRARRQRRERFGEAVRQVSAQERERRFLTNLLDRAGISGRDSRESLLSLRGVRPARRRTSREESPSRDTPLRGERPDLLTVDKPVSRISPEKERRFLKDILDRIGSEPRASRLPPGRPQRLLSLSELRALRGRRREDFSVEAPTAEAAARVARPDVSDAFTGAFGRGRDFFEIGSSRGSGRLRSGALRRPDTGLRPEGVIRIPTTGERVAFGSRVRRPDNLMSARRFSFASRRGLRLGPRTPLQLDEREGVVSRSRFGQFFRQETGVRERQLPRERYRTRTGLRQFFRQGARPRTRERTRSRLREFFRGRERFRGGRRVREETTRIPGLDDPGRGPGGSPGFFVDVKREGEFRQSGVRALPRGEAIRRGARETGGSPAMTFRLRRGPDVSSPGRSVPKSFRESFRRKDRNVFVEKRSKAIDSPGELRGITQKGLRARRGGGFGGLL